MGDGGIRGVFVPENPVAVELGGGKGFLYHGGRFQINDCFSSIAHPGDTVRSTGETQRGGCKRFFDSNILRCVICPELHICPDVWCILFGNLAIPETIQIFTGFMNEAPSLGGMVEAVLGYIPVYFPAEKTGKLTDGRNGFTVQCIGVLFVIKAENLCHSIASVHESGFIQNNGAADFLK